MLRQPTRHRRSDFQDLTGKVFRYLTVLRFVGIRDFPESGNQDSQWLCQCICGNTTIVGGARLKAGTSHSCGCRGAWLGNLHDRLLDGVIWVPGGCWEWRKTRAQKEYGAIKVERGKREQAHRAAYRLFCGPIPEGMCVLHHCDNPPCCNPTHLFLGTDADNIYDMVRKNRHMKGEDSPHAKLTEADVREIKRRLAEGECYRALAEEFGVHRSPVWLIMKGRTWKHVT